MTSCMQGRSSPLRTRAAGMGCLASLPEDAVGFTTIELKTNFLATAREGALRCSARLVHGGERTQVWDATVSREEDERVIALFRCTQYLLPADDARTERQRQNSDPEGADMSAPSDRPRRDRAPRVLERSAKLRAGPSAALRRKREADRARAHGVREPPRLRHDDGRPSTTRATRSSRPGTCTTGRGRWRATSRRREPRSPTSATS